MSKNTFPLTLPGSKQRAGRSSPQDLARYLRAAPKAPPVEGDVVG